MARKDFKFKVDNKGKVVRKGLNDFEILFAITVVNIAKKECNVLDLEKEINKTTMKGDGFDAKIRSELKEDGREYSVKWVEKSKHK